MRISRISAYNYKSLRDIRFDPEGLSVVIGANAAGKSNLADLHDFVSDLYRHGLATAVARKGGYENIAHRKMRRSRGAISVGLTAILTNRDLRAWPRAYRGSKEFRFEHDFSVQTEGQAIRADFKIVHEKISIEREVKGEWLKLATVFRSGNEITYDVEESIENMGSSPGPLSLQRQFRFLDNLDEFLELESVSSTELVFDSLSRFVPVLRRISQQLSEIRVFQLSPTNTREFGVPIPDPEMDRYGGNLPAVVDMLIQRHPKIWSNITGIMGQLLPGLESIEVDYTPSRTLGIYFHEKGVGRPWSVAEVSDGTIHCLALLVALFDPRTTVLVLEEPENSVHTWILRLLMEASLRAAKGKQILITTHSGVVVDCTPAENIWVMWRHNGESNIASLACLDNDLVSLVAEGDMSTFELLDSGVVSQALPPAPKGY